MEKQELGSSSAVWCEISGCQSAKAHGRMEPSPDDKGNLVMVHGSARQNKNDCLFHDLAK
jgi:hypothetical protein